MKAFAIGLLGVLVAGNVSQARDITTSPGSGSSQLDIKVVEPPSARAPLDAQKLYKISVSCKKTNQPLPEESFWDPLIHKEETTAHYVAFSNDAADPDPAAAGKIKMPTALLRMAHLYSFKGEERYYGMRSCPEPFVVEGSTPVYMTPVAAYSSTHTPGFMSQIGYQVAKLIPILASVFQPTLLAPDVSKQITAFPQTEDPIKAIVKTFDKTRSFGEGIKMRTGTYTVTTKYSSTTITVENIASIVLAKPASLQKGFRDQLKSAPEKIPADKVATTCGQIAASLKPLGFTETEDIPFALTYLASQSVVTKGKILECLGDDYAANAVKLGPVLWGLIRESVRLKQDDIDNIQPTFSGIESSIYKLILNMSRISKNGADMVPGDLASLKTMTAEKIKVIDNTPDGYFAGINKEVEASALVDLFTGNKDGEGKDRKYFRFGCYAAIGDKSGPGIDPAPVAFLAFNIGKTEMKAKPSDAVFVRVIYKRKLVSELRIHNDAAWIKANLDAKDWDCNGLEVTKPATSSHESPQAQRLGLAAASQPAVSQ